LWRKLGQSYLTLSEADLQKQVAKDQSSIEFLKEFMEEVAQHGSPATLGTSQRVKDLLETNFRLSSRLLEVPSSGLMEWHFLADFSRVYNYKKNRAQAVLEAAAGRQAFEASLLTLKKSLARDLDAGIKGDLKATEATLKRLNFLLDSSPDAAAFFLAGSDFLDGLITCYRVMNPPLRKTIVATTYLCLIGLTEGVNPKFSMLSDQLYALKEAADAHKAGPLNANDSLVPELVSSTPFLKNSLARAEEADAATAAIKTRIKALEVYRKTGRIAPRPRRVKRKVDKGKGKVVELDGGGMDEQRVGQISQIQELFPHLGSGYVARLLDEYEGPEEATAALLEGSLPEYLANADQEEEL
jgi:activating signal cointegrator complex subunit 2